MKPHLWNSNVECHIVCLDGHLEVENRICGSENMLPLNVEGKTRKPSSSSDESDLATARSKWN